MAIIDQHLLLARREAFTADETFDTIDLLTMGDIGMGEPLYAVVQVSTTLDAASGNESYAVIFEMADLEAFSGSGHNTTEFDRITLSRGDVAGTQYTKFIPYGVDKRYIRARIDTGGTTPSGAVTVYLTCEPPATPAQDTLYRGVV